MCLAAPCFRPLVLMIVLTDSASNRVDTQQWNQKDVGRAIVESGLARRDLTITTKIGGCSGEFLGFDSALASTAPTWMSLG